jgi:heme A synthase
MLPATRRVRSARCCTGCIARRGQRAGALLIALLLLQPLLGALLVVGGLPLPLALAHNIAAAGLLAALASLAGSFAPDQEKVS